MLASVASSVLGKSAFEHAVYGSWRPGRSQALVDRLSELGVSTAHWTGRNTKKPSVSARRQKDIRKHSVQNVRKRILQDGLVPYVCAECDMLPKWNGKPLTLHMDHIDGDNSNNDLKNLRFLCPNCHQQTYTWGNKRSRKLPSDKVLLEHASEGMTRKEIAAKYNVHPSTVSHRLRLYND